MIRERGYDPEVVLREIAEWNRKWDAAGVILDCDPRQRSQQGQPAEARPGRRLRARSRNDGRGEMRSWGYRMARPERARPVITDLVTGQVKAEDLDQPAPPVVVAIEVKIQAARASDARQRTSPAGRAGSRDGMQRFAQALGHVGPRPPHGAA